MIKGGGNRVVDWIWTLCNMGFLVDRIRKVTGDLSDDEHGGFRAGRGCVD